MTGQLDPKLMSEVSHLIAERLGLFFPESRWADLARGLRGACGELGCPEPEACVRWLMTRDLTVAQLGVLASHLTVGETYFFRDPESYQCLQREILPPLLARRQAAGRTLRLWSAGCCTGEEAYSLAILCLRTIPDVRDWSVSILATDVNPAYLRKAAEGVYSDWSFRDAPAWLREGFFTPVAGKKLVLSPSVRALVSFAYLNLALDAYPSLYNHTNAMDVIFCRNVLMYFTPEGQRKVVSALHGCLVDGGCLLVNPAEASPSLFAQFGMETRGGVILFRKGPASGVVDPGQIWSAPIPDRPFPAQEPSAPFSEEAAPLRPETDRRDSVVPDVSSGAPPAGPGSFEVAARLLEEGDPTAPARLEEIADLEPDLARAPLLLARFLANRGRLAEALAWCQRATGAERASGSAHFLAATVLQELGRFQEAVAAFGRVLYLDQDSILAHHALGGLYRKIGKERDSRRHLALVLELLALRNKEEVLPESDGMTCGRLAEAVKAMTEG